MLIKLSVSIIITIILSVAINAQRTIDGVKVGIINGAATYLPKPEYPKEAADFCVGGKVEIEVLVGENGNVIEAKAISGDKLLRDVSVEAVKKAKFRKIDDVPLTKIKGIVIYNFDSFSKCLDAGVVNKKAEFIPKAEFPKSCRCVGTIYVQVVIDILSGKVTKARAISGHPLLRISAVKSALQVRFKPTFIDTNQQFYAKGILVYKF